jgi:uncharacterized protein (TIGR02246 family)
MRLLAAAVLVLAAANAKPTPEKPVNIPPLAPVQQVYDAIDEQVAAWNRADLDGFCSVYAEDALFVSPTGVTRGRAAVRERYGKKYGADKAGMGTLAIEPVEARAFPADASAKSVSVAAKWTLTWPGKPPATGHTLIVFRPRAGGGWELVQDASM